MSLDDNDNPDNETMLSCCVTKEQLNNKKYGIVCFFVVKTRNRLIMENTMHSLLFVVKQAWRRNYSTLTGSFFDRKLNKTL